MSYSLFLETAALEVFAEESRVPVRWDIPEFTMEDGTLIEDAEWA